MNALTEIESTELTRCEEVIRRNIKAFHEMGTALMKIRDERLYRAEFRTFIASASVVANLDSMVSKPETERQARPLTKGV